MKIYLRVPYHEKEDAKRLGARWDGARKLWYIPEGVERAVFAQWPDAEAPAPLLPQAATETSVALSLETFLGKVQGIVQQHLPSLYWVRAELAEQRTTVGGHLQLGLVEYDALGKQTAKASAWLWKQDIARILQPFEKLTGGTLEAGIKLQLLVHPDFSPTYGFSLHISDIDPSYTLGDMAAKLAMIRDMLRQDGLLELNRSLEMPRDFCRVAVISPLAAAGLGDFRQSADPLADAGICAFHYYACRFQGKAAAADILEALQRVLADHRHRPFDCVCIIRGGGAGVDLHWLNALELAKAVCLAPMPVITGIGHERDQTILDEVAKVRMDTPSKVIGFLIHTILENVREAEKDMMSIIQKAHYQWQSAHQATHTLHQQIIEYAEVQVQRAHERTESQMASLLLLSENRLQTANMHLSLQKQSLTEIMTDHLRRGEQQIDTLRMLVFERADHLLQRAQTETRALGESIIGQGPMPVLRRGYALLRTPGGMVISTLEKLQQHSRLSIELSDGIAAIEYKDKKNHE